MQRVVHLARNERGDGVDSSLASLHLDQGKAGIDEKPVDPFDGKAPEVERQLVLTPHEGDGDHGRAPGLEHPEELARQLSRATRVLEHLRRSRRRTMRRRRGSSPRRRTCRRASALPGDHCPRRRSRCTSIRRRDFRTVGCHIQRQGRLPGRPIERTARPSARCRCRGNRRQPSRGRLATVERRTRPAHALLRRR